MPRTSGEQTRQRILTVAFDLFAERGYRAVSIRDIAAEVGVKDASLYNHFPTKQAIFDAVVASSLEQTLQRFAEQGVMRGPTDDPRGYAGSPDQVERLVLDGYRPFFEDPTLVKLHRLLATARFEDEPAANAFRLVFIDKPLDIQTAVFTHLMDTGLFNPDDPRALALAFHGPVFLLLSAGITWDQAQPAIKDHFHRFIRAHQSPHGKE